MACLIETTDDKFYGSGFKTKTISNNFHPLVYNSQAHLGVTSCSSAVGSFVVIFSCRHGSSMARPWVARLIKLLARKMYNDKKVAAPIKQPWLSAICNSWKLWDIPWILSLAGWGVAPSGKMYGTNMQKDAKGMFPKQTDWKIWENMVKWCTFHAPGSMW